MAHILITHYIECNYRILDFHFPETETKFPVNRDDKNSAVIKIHAKTADFIVNWWFRTIQEYKIGLARPL